MGYRLCKTCKNKRRETLFSLIDYEEGTRQDICRICNYDGFTADQKHKILREAFRNYLTWKDLLIYGSTDGSVTDVITYHIPKEEGSDEYVPITISFYDLERSLTSFSERNNAEGTVLSKRKEEAFHLNVIRDMLQRDVADIMGISTGSVGQYVEQGMIQLCDYYFAEEEDTPNVPSTKGNT